MMNKLLITALVALCAIPGYAQVAGYTVKGEVAGVKAGKAVLTVYEPQALRISDTVNLANGRFEFKGSIKEAVSAVLHILPEGNPSAAMGLLLENAPITVALDYKDVKEQYGSHRFTKQRVTGGANQQLSEAFSKGLEQVRNQPKFAAYKKAWEEVDALREKDLAAYKATFDRVKKETEADQEQIRKESQAAALELIAAHPDTEFAAYILNMQANYMALGELEIAFNRFTPKVQESYFAERIREEIKNLKAVAPGQTAPDFTLKALNGTQFTLSSLKGKYVLVDFWASWCGPCRASVPDLKELYAKYKDFGLELVGVTNDSREKDWKKAVADDQTPWIHVIDEFPIKNRPAKVATLYAIPYLPSYYLIGPDGKMIGRLEKSELKAKLKEIFGE